VDEARAPARTAGRHSPRCGARLLPHERRRAVLCSGCGRDRAGADRPALAMACPRCTLPRVACPRDPARSSTARLQAVSSSRRPASVTCSRPARRPGGRGAPPRHAAPRGSGALLPCPDAVASCTAATSAARRVIVTSAHTRIWSNGASCRACWHRGWRWARTRRVPAARGGGLADPARTAAPPSAVSVRRQALHLRCRLVDGLADAAQASSLRPRLMR
jgi:hypothetical protein